VRSRGNTSQESPVTIGFRCYKSLRSPQTAPSKPEHPKRGVEQQSGLPRDHATFCSGHHPGLDRLTEKREQYPGPGGKWQISTAGGSTPRWRRDGKELYFVSADRKLMSASVSGQGEVFAVGTVQALFDTTIRQIGFAGANAINYDVSPDGQRFLILSTQDNAATTPITLVVNWTGLMKK
jgi:hypothetical protein